MLKEKLTIERRKAVMLEVDFSGRTVEEYAMAWLKLTNNAREYSNLIWKIKNIPGSKVYVICKPEAVEQVREFCTDIVSFYSEDDDKIHSVGKVLNESDVIVGVPVYEWDSTCDCDDPEWEEDFDKSIHEWLMVDEG